MEDLTVEQFNAKLAESIKDGCYKTGGHSYFRVRNGLVTCAYHKISDNIHPSITKMSIETFKASIMSFPYKHELTTCSDEEFSDNILSIALELLH